MTIKIQDVAYVRFSAPDLSRMREFLLDFGLQDAEDAQDGVLRMRGSNDAPYLHETVHGDPGFVALGLKAASPEDLEMLARTEERRSENLNGPGGGRKVTLRDPNGFLLEVVAGISPAPAAAPNTGAPWNFAASRGRSGEPRRVAIRPAHVVRLGHVVLGVNDTAESWAWWRDRFGLIMSDEVRAPNGDLAAAFIRFDRGADPTDHHSLNFASIPGKPAAFHHAAFEVEDLDDLMAGHEHLKRTERQHDWGVGRHVLGSQVFDYWKDPWGHRVEHWTDGDLFTAHTPPNVTDVPTMLGIQWGPAAPADFA